MSILYKFFQAIKKKKERLSNPFYEASINDTRYHKMLQKSEITKQIHSWKLTYCDKDHKCR